MYPVLQRALAKCVRDRLAVQLPVYYCWAHRGLNVFDRDVFELLEPPRQTLPIIEDDCDPAFVRFLDNNSHCTASFLRGGRLLVSESGRREGALTLPHTHNYYKGMGYFVKSPVLIYQKAYVSCTQLPFQF